MHACQGRWATSTRPAAIGPKPQFLLATPFQFAFGGVEFLPVFRGDRRQQLTSALPFAPLLGVHRLQELFTGDDRRFEAALSLEGARRHHHRREAVRMDERRAVKERRMPDAGGVDDVAFERGGRSADHACGKRVPALADFR